MTIEKATNMAEGQNLRELHIAELRQRAIKVVVLIEKMNEIFPNARNEDEHAITAIMACIDDAYRQGIRDAMNHYESRTDTPSDEI